MLIFYIFVLFVYLDLYPQSSIFRRKVPESDEKTNYYYGVFYRNQHGNYYIPATLIFIEYRQSKIKNSL